MLALLLAKSAIAKPKQQFLRAATQNAQSQANAVLSSLNLSQKEVVSIQVNNASSPPPIIKVAWDVLSNETT